MSLMISTKLKKSENGGKFPSLNFCIINIKLLIGWQGKNFFIKEILNLLLNFTFKFINRRARNKKNKCKYCYKSRFLTKIVEWFKL